MKLTADLSDAFFGKLRDVSSRLGCEPVNLLSVMMSESGVKAKAHNPNGDASGLIQFIPKTLANLGWPNGQAAFRQLSAEEQLPYVEKYFSPYISKGLTSAARLYQATFLPATLNLGSDPDTVISESGGINSFVYNPNKLFDTNKDQKITVGGLQEAIDRNTHGGRWNEIVSRFNGEPIDETIDLFTIYGVQQALIDLGYDPGMVDGIDGPKTQKAVMEFQGDEGLDIDGIVGPNTRAAFAAALEAIGIPHNP